MHTQLDNLPAPLTNTNHSAIPVLSQWIGSWQIQIGRRALTPYELSNRYDAMATRWDKTLNKYDTAQAYRVLLSKALPDHLVLEDNATPRILDCGTGTGTFLSACADMVSGIPELHGIDVSAAMIEKAKDSFADRALDAELIQGNLTALPYPSNQFDIVLAAHVVEHISDPQLALAEMARVLKPGGTILICVTRKSIMGRAIQLKWRTHIVDEAEAASWLGQAGLKSIYPLRALSVGDFDKMSIACTARKPELLEKEYV